MTRNDNRQQNAERRLRHATWAREPAFPAWSLWLCAAFAAPFVASFLGAN